MNSHRPVVAGIFQARLGSSRLPGKVLMDICGKPLLWHVIHRVRAAKTIDKLIVATTESPTDEPLRDFLAQEGVTTVLGSENDVLDRFYQSARAHDVDVFVRITPDDPFKDPEVIDHAVNLLRTASPSVDYVANCSYDGSIPSTYPEGLDIEVMTMDCLARLWQGATRPSEREHVSPYLFAHPEKFKVLGFQCPENLAHLRWTIDYDQDMQFAREVYARLYERKPLFLMRDILELLQAEPELTAINTGITRYEGYKRSVRKERPEGVGE